MFSKENTLITDFYTCWQQRNCHIAEGFIDHTRGTNIDNGPASVSATKFDENKASAPSSLPVIGQNLVESDISTATTFKERGQQPESTSKAVPFNAPIQSNIFGFGRASNVATSPISPKRASSTDKTMTWPPPQFRSCTSNSNGAGNKTKDQEPTIESGTINISSVYSQG